MRKSRVTDIRADASALVEHVLGSFLDLSLALGRSSPPAGSSSLFTLLTMVSLALALHSVGL